MIKLILILLVLTSTGMTFNGVTMNGLKNASASKILTIGDSITNGNQTGNPSGKWFGYRDALQDLVGINTYDFVGPYSSPVSSDPAYDKNHGGLSAEQTTAMLARFDTALSYITGESNYANSWVLIHAGTNDCINQASCGPAVANIQSMIDQAHAYNPNINVMVALILPSNYSATVDTRIQDLQAPLKSMLDIYRGTKTNLHYVDMNTMFNTEAYCSGGFANCLSDTVHPNFVGYDLMATAWNLCITTPLATYCDGN